MKVAIPSNTPGGPDARISPHFGRCDVFTVVEIKNGKIVGGSTIDNRGAHFGFDKTPAEILVSSGIDVVVAQGMGPKALELLGQSGIKTYFTSAKTVGKAVRELIEGKAKLATPEEACNEPRSATEPPPTPLMPPFGPGMGRGMGRGMGGEWGPTHTPPLTHQWPRQCRILHNKCQNLLSRQQAALKWVSRAKGLEGSTTWYRQSSAGAQALPSSRSKGKTSRM